MSSFEKFSVPAWQADKTGPIWKPDACSLRNAMMWWWYVEQIFIVSKLHVVVSLQNVNLA